MRARHLALAAGALVLTQGSARAQVPTVRDSAGVQITENPAREAFRINLKLGDSPILDVGGLHDDNPDAEFDASRGYLRGVRLSDGGLAVVDVNHIKYFDASGTLRKVAGRGGDGPGEFRDLNAICRTRGDTIVVADRSRLGVLDKHGTFIRHVPSTPRFLPVDGCFGDGTFLLSNATYRTPTPTTRTTHLWRMGLDGTEVDSLGDMVFPFGDVVLQGEITWLAAGSKLYVGDPYRKDLHVFELSQRVAGGRVSSVAPMKLVMSIRTADRAVPITDAALEERLALMVGVNMSDTERRARMDQMRAMPRASTWPTIGRIYADPDGNLWVADYLQHWGAPTGYSKFDANGRLVGRLVIPAATPPARALRVIGFGRNDILVRRSDDDGAAHLSVYPLVPLRKDP